LTNMRRIFTSYRSRRNPFKWNHCNWNRTKLSIRSDTGQRNPEI